MNLGFDAKRLFNNHSGLGQYSRYILRNLTRLYGDHRYFLFTNKTSHLYTPGQTEKSVILPSPAFYSRSINMRRQWRKHDIEIYHGLSNELPFVRASGTKTVVTIHDLLFEDFPEDYPWIDRQIYRLKTRRALSMADAVIAISQTTKTELVDRYGIEPARVDVIYQSCREDFFKQIDLEDIDKTLQKYGLARPFILCVSSFSHRKDQKVLVEAFAESRLTESCDLVLIGAESEYKNEVRKQVSSLGLNEGVVFPEVASDEDIVRLYRGCRMVVYPSKKEGFGIPVIEGMASGKPVVVRSHTSCEEAGGDAVAVFDGSSQGLASAMTRVLKNESVYSEMVKRGQSRVERFSPDIEMKKLMEVYERLARN